MRLGRGQVSTRSPPVLRVTDRVSMTPDSSTLRSVRVQETTGPAWAYEGRRDTPPQASATPRESERVEWDGLGRPEQKVSKGAFGVGGQGDGTGFVREGQGFVGEGQGTRRQERDRGTEGQGVSKEGTGERETGDRGVEDRGGTDVGRQGRGRGQRDRGGTGNRGI